MRMSRAFILPIFILLACNPCEIEFIGETAVIAPQSCAPETSGDMSSTNGTGWGSASPSSTGDTYGDVLPTCIAVPGPGEAWGPCHIGEVCDPGLFCFNPGPGNICLADCVDNECGHDDKCIGGTCDHAKDKCVPTCDANNACPIEGMLCLEWQCMYSAFAP